MDALMASYVSSETPHQRNGHPVGRTAVITKDNRIFVGVITGFDQASNLVLENCSECVSATGSIELGTIVIRGDNV